MAEDFGLTAVTGIYFHESKAEMIARWTRAGTQGATSHSTLTKINRTFESGDFSYAAGEIEDRTLTGSTRQCSTHTFTDIWAQRGSRWVWIQSHESGVRETTCPP